MAGEKRVKGREQLLLQRAGRLVLQVVSLDQQQHHLEMCYNYQFSGPPRPTESAWERGQAIWFNGGGGLGIIDPLYR